MIRSAYIICNIRTTNDKVRVGESHMIDVVGYGTLTVVFPGSLRVRMLDIPGV